MQDDHGHQTVANGMASAAIVPGQPVGRLLRPDASKPMPAAQDATMPANRGMRSHGRAIAPRRASARPPRRKRAAREEAPKRQGKLEP